MDKIMVKDILVTGNRVEFFLTLEGDVAKYFTDINYFLEYDEDISEVPKGILVIPFLCSVLPLSWLANAEIIVDELDKEFYNCIESLKKAYAKRYYKLPFLGSVTVNNIMEYAPIVGDKKLVFFSGGVDSLSSVVSYIDDKPQLFTVWGSDIPLGAEKEWEIVKQNALSFGQDRGLKNVFVKSSFRQHFDEWMGTLAFSDKLGTDYWRGIQHSMALISLAIPYAYKNNISNIYFPSTFTKKDWLAGDLCASYPYFDELIKSSNMQVIHDGYEYTRQDKIANIVSYIKKTNSIFPIRVCWETVTGNNCDTCRKCRVTFMELLAEKIDPNLYGFDISKEIIKNEMPDMWKNSAKTSEGELVLWFTEWWVDVQNVFIKNKEHFKNTPEVQWIYKIDFIKEMNKYNKKVKNARIINYIRKILCIK